MGAGNAVDSGGVISDAKAAAISASRCAGGAIPAEAASAGPPVAGVSLTGVVIAGATGVGTLCDEASRLRHAGK